MTTHKPCPFCGIDLTELRAGKTLVHPDNGCILDEFQFSDDFLPEWERRAGEPRRCCANCKYGDDVTNGFFSCYRDEDDDGRAKTPDDVCNSWEADE